MSTKHPVIIEFRKSRSMYYRQVITQIKKFGLYQLSKDEGGEVSRVWLDDRRTLLDMEGIIRRLSGWKSARIIHDGYLVPFDVTLLLIKCANYRNVPEHGPWTCTFEKLKAAHDPFDYWCEQIGVGARQWSESNWWDYGEVDGEGIFRVDKVAIRSLLEEAARCRHLALCPYFNLQKARLAVDDLPDTINPRRSEDWTYRRVWQDGKEFKTGIQVVWPSIPREEFDEKMREAYENMRPTTSIGMGPEEVEDTVDDFLNSVRKDWKNGQA